ncbi:hypothetical protein IGI04_018529, partial [Brassica rapa subsp. trilocularis]
VFHHMILIFHSFKDMDLDIQVFHIWKTSGLEDFQEVFQMTSRKSSDRVYSYTLEDLLEVFSEVFQTTSRKSSEGVFFHIKSTLSLSLKSQISDTIRSNAKLTRLAYTTYMEVVSISNKDGRFPKVFHVSRLQPDDLPISRLDEQIWKKNTNFIVSTSEITCLEHKSLL